MSTSNGHGGKIFTSGSLLGIGEGLRLLALLFGWVLDDEPMAIEIWWAKRKYAWSLSPEDRRLYRRHRRRRRQYIRYRHRLHHAIREECYRQFKKNPPNHRIGEHITRQLQIVPIVSKRVKGYGEDWSDVTEAGDCPLGLPCEEGGRLDGSRWIPEKPVWTPPDWRT